MDAKIIKTYAQVQKPARSKGEMNNAAIRVLPVAGDGRQFDDAEVVIQSPYVRMQKPARSKGIMNNAAIPFFLSPTATNIKAWGETSEANGTLGSMLTTPRIRVLPVANGDKY